MLYHQNNIHACMRLQSIPFIEGIHTDTCLSIEHFVCIHEYIFIFIQIRYSNVLIHISIQPINSPNAIGSIKAQHVTNCFV